VKREVPLVAAVAVALAAVACGSSTQERAYEYMPDMARDPAYKAFAPNPVTRDGLTTTASPVPPRHFIRVDARSPSGWKQWRAAAVDTRSSLITSWGAIRLCRE
jgi:hypothetical protein